MMAKRGTSSKRVEQAETKSFWGTKGRYVENKKQLAEIIAALRTIGARIVLTQGTFDFIHIGHFLYLEQARQHGDILIVGVDSDKKVRTRKGPDRPIVSEKERVQMLTHVRHVDIVALKQLGDPKWSLIKLVRPDTLIATAGTYTPQQVKQLKQFCGQVVILEPQATTSTTAKLRRLNIGLSHKIKEAITESINDTFDKLMKNA
ncbi:adenylyltransferase/cytidyltransferase family protein [Candidatus Saccharibacteria bacterium]|nr:adenylyltransferase/cytidyltransferase family protein [Candidatus Saccharibacteria bacterium]